MTNLCFACLWVCWSAGVWLLLDRLGRARVQLSDRLGSAPRISFWEEWLPGAQSSGKSQAFKSWAKPRNDDSLGFAHMLLAKANHMAKAQTNRVGVCTPPLLGGTSGPIA